MSFIIIITSILLLLFIMIITNHEFLSIIIRITNHPYFVDHQEQFRKLVNQETI